MTTAWEPHPSTGQPVGLPVDETPARAAGAGDARQAGTDAWSGLRRATCRGIVGVPARPRPRLDLHVDLRPIRGLRDILAMARRPRRQLDDPYSYAVVDRSGRAVGIATLMEIRPAMRVIEVGAHRLFAGADAHAARHRGAVSPRPLRVRDLGYRRYEWKCNALNAASRRAALRYGFIYEGTFRQH